MLSNGITNIDSITDFHDYVDLAKELGMKAFGFAEHGSIFGWLKKKEYIESCGMKYIHAIEAYLTEDNEKTEKKKADNYHIVLIARNYEGVKELNKLISKSFTRSDFHYYYYPRISFEELFATTDNILVTSACLGGALHKGTPTAKEQMLSFLSENKHRCFLEIQHHNVNEQRIYNQTLYGLHRKLGIPLIAGTDTHALNEEHMDGRRMLQRAKDVKFADEEKWDLTFKSYDELVEAYRVQNALPMDVIYEALKNTNKMADMIEEFSLDYSSKYPKLYDNSEKVFREKINEGVVKRGINKYPNYQKYKDRIRYEYDVYKHNGAIDFMLLEENYKAEMRKRGVKYGYSRGSVSGSIIAYLLYITEIDSIKYNLNFERFMNKERVSLADVDSDWLSEDRDVVKDYLHGKEGLYCCDIITFNTIALKGAIRDVCRSLYKNTDKNYLKLSEEIIAESEANEQAARKKYPDVFRYVDMVNGVVVSVGNHPAGCVVSPYPVDEWFGTFTTSSDKYPISMLNMKEIDKLNFVKLDILGLDNIGLIYKTCDELKIPFATPDNIPPDDYDVWKSIVEDTTMIFQWESKSATAYLRQLMSEDTIKKIREVNPNASFMDLFSIGNGAIRPAGESYRDKLAQGIYQDNGHEALNNFLAPTLGYLVYQEQIIEFLHSFCGYTMGEADIVRRGFAKKTGTDKFIPKIKEGFQRTMLEKYNVSTEESDKLIVNFIKVIEDASDYLFSKNHADPYSWIGYICGYLRYYYPLEFITTALNIFADNETKSSAIINYAQKRGIIISPIKFRHSVAKYSYDKKTNTIFKGIASVKFMNETVSQQLDELRHEYYCDFFDYLEDNPCNSRQLEILIQLNYFEEFGTPNELMQYVKIYDLYGSKKQLKKDKVQHPEIFDRYCTSTEKIYKISDRLGLMRALVEAMPVEKERLSTLLFAQKEYLGYIDYIDESKKNMVFVMSVDTKYSPRIEAYSLAKGNIMTLKIKKSTFNKDKLNVGDIIQINGFKRKNKLKYKDGDYIPVPNEYDWWLEKYAKVNNI